MQGINIDTPDYAQKFDQSCREKNCGIIEGYDSRVDVLTTKVAELSAEFLRLPGDILMKYDARASNGEKGVTYKLKPRKVDGVPFYEIRRHLMVGDELEPDHPLVAFRDYNRRKENIVIEEREFQELIPLAVALNRQVERTVVGLYKGIAEARGLPSGYWAARLAWGNHTVRSLHYEGIEGDFTVSDLNGLDVHGTTVHGVQVLEGEYKGEYQKNIIRASPHKDIDVVAALLKATQPGFVMQQRDGTLLRYTANEGSILLNAGHLAEHETSYVNNEGKTDSQWRAGAHFVEAVDAVKPRDLVVVFMHYKESDPVIVMPENRDPRVLAKFPDTTETEKLTDVLVERNYVPEDKVDKERALAKAAVEALPARKMFEEIIEHEIKHNYEKHGEARLLEFADQMPQLYRLWGI